ncbi:TetR/AcrR family transcriptional regulator [Cellulomonas xiejunii]|uniref:TetR/AcrR family transcriptional regulator C-terminal domain-containing protein n=1 Tax=Cellulomonas xiejunii TaxID=2968083 RepID=A0ABY5KIS6_9CELL|nr:TetR/AcrR family transcriptional regulator C-terminal domain-containing protein [Cellulomonas xiejunii]MCC2320054.1 TetR/AcrR family transcriptional regulator C-terminal domain-containing protein [Cellulomonas xiejunii]UUI70367.1 TetR/AcrR family transcriptional regulator C-terminal domain-containing protein [Cellulomonas xiejunii]
MSRELIDLLWRDHPAAPASGTRGPRSKVSTSQVVDTATGIADRDGLPAVTVRRLGVTLGIAPNAVYTHVGSRDDLLVLMADAIRAVRPRLPHLDGTWQARVRAVAQDELALYAAHPWLLDVTDPRTAFGPGTIATYDHQLHALDGTGLDDVERDAALAFVGDFVRASARSFLPDPHSAQIATVWSAWQGRLTDYVGDRFPLARRVGAAAGAAMNAPSSAEHTWRFGLDRVLDALAALVSAAGSRSGTDGLPGA